MDRPSHINVDELQAQTTLEEAAAKCGVTLDLLGYGENVRLDCPFGCSGDHAGKRELSVNVTNPQKVFCCHAYQCQVRGNLLTLMHGWLTGTRPLGDKLKGDEFTRVRNVLVGKPTPPPSSEPRAVRGAPAGTPASTKHVRNVPLSRSENEKARELVTLDAKFVTDVAAMPPTAASYIRRHPCLTEAAMQKWRVGVLPQDGGGDKRGWSLRGHILYPVLGEDGQLLAWVGRDPQFEMKEQAFNLLPPDERKKEKRPMKHRFPTDFHRGQELFGQHASRLQEPGYRDAVAQHGIIVCEGFNDVIGLDSLGIPAVAIMSNKITEQQVEEIHRWARQLSGGKVMLLFDADDAGDEGAKEALWLLAQQGLNVRLGWTSKMFDGKFKGRQPESMTGDEWNGLIVQSK